MNGSTLERPLTVTPRSLAETVLLSIDPGLRADARGIQVFHAASCSTHLNLRPLVSSSLLARFIFKKFTVTKRRYNFFVHRETTSEMNLPQPVAATIIVHMCLLLTSCSGQDLIVDPGQSGMRSDTLFEFSSVHLTFTYTRYDRDSIQAIARYVEARRANIVADIQPDTLSTIRIILYATLSEVHRAIGWADAPKWVKGAVSGIGEVRMISPSSPDLERSVSYHYMLSCIVHEFTHCVMLHANRTIANRPRWLWESIAIYESGQSADLKSLGYLTTGSLPTLDDLNNTNDTRVYEVGYSIAEYIVNKWGTEALRGLIRTNGDLVNTLHISQGEFQEGWYAYVMNTYSQ